VFLRKFPTLLCNLDHFSKEKYLMLIIKRFSLEKRTTKFSPKESDSMDKVHQFEVALFHNKSSNKLDSGEEVKGYYE
jgi:hypothetical protein